jgi:NitT/TauT family transport system substrate-binding protein
MLALALSGGARAEDRKETVRFQDYPGLGNLMIRVARSKGWCSAAGFDCELVQIPSAPQGVQALVGGSIDVAMTDTAVAAIAKSRGAGIRLIAGAYVAGVALIAVRNDVPMPNEAQGYPAVMNDLKGRRFGLPALGGSGQSLVKYLFQAAGVAEPDVSFATVGAFNTAFAALTGGRVDAIVSFEPAGLMCEATRSCRVVWRQATAAAPAELRALYGAGAALTVRTGMLERRPELARTIMQLARRAEAFINDPANKAEVLRISSEYSSLDMPDGAELERRLLERGLAARGYRAVVKRSAVAATLAFVQRMESIPMPAVTELVWAEAPEE